MEVYIVTARIIPFNRELHPKNTQELQNLYLSLEPDQRKLLFASTALAADILGIRRRTLQLWIKKRFALAIRTGKKYQVYLPAVKRYISEGSTRNWRNSRNAPIARSVSAEFSQSNSTQIQTAMAGICSEEEGKKGAESEDALLTNRERQIACLISENQANKEIAQNLNISISTVKTHVHQILRKLGLRKRSHLEKYKASGIKPDINV